VFLHVVQGNASVNGEAVASGDGLQIIDEHEVVVSAAADVEILLFDMG
jgi:redox-sensitive bicupin YhaK (pirin superfamily)